MNNQIEYKCPICGADSLSTDFTDGMECGYSAGYKAGDRDGFRAGIKRMSALQRVDTAPGFDSIRGSSDERVL